MEAELSLVSRQLPFALRPFGKGNKQWHQLDEGDLVQWCCDLPDVPS